MFAVPQSRPFRICRGCNCATLHKPSNEVQPQHLCSNNNLHDSDLGHSETMESRQFGMDLDDRQNARCFTVKPDDWAELNSKHQCRSSITPLVPSSAVLAVMPNSANETYDA